MRPTFIQILDSRGNPTIQGCFDGFAIPITAAVPSGASTGKHEAVELRDGDAAYGGKTVLSAVDNANGLSRSLAWNPANIVESDALMQSLDGTKNKQNMGANAILCVSMLQARVQAVQQEKPLYELLSSLAHTTPRLPVPFANIINGGRHASNDLMFQEFMIVPHAASSFYEATKQVAEVTHILKGLITKTYGPGQTGVGDEGGFAPNISSPKEACELLVNAMDLAGYDMAIAIDAAASEFFDSGTYEPAKDHFMNADQLLEYYISLIETYPIVSLEDPFDEDDFAAFARLRKAIHKKQLRCQVVGDDLTVSNVQRVKQAIDEGSCDCLLLKINQIGSVTEAIASARLALDNNWGVMVSHRSGETEDSFIADLAVALGTGQIKLGAPVRGERTAKYNRLLTLEQKYGLPFASNKAI